MPIPDPRFLPRVQSSVTWENIDAQLGIDLERVGLVLGQNNGLGCLDAREAEVRNLLHHGCDQVVDACLCSHGGGGADKAEADDSTVAAGCRHACGVDTDRHLLAGGCQGDRRCREGQR